MIETNVPQQLETVTFVLDGIPFTGKLIKKYVTADHDIMLAVRVESYEINGVAYAAEADDSAVRISADYLV